MSTLGTDKVFLHETAVYELLHSRGLMVPRYGAVRDEADIAKLPFAEGEAVVVKGIADDFWHKSDEGGVHFLPFSAKSILALHQEMKARIGKKYPYIETLVCKKSDFKKTASLPSEAFVSIKRDEACGLIINFGVGGIHTEAWAKELHSNILMWPVAMISPEQALCELKQHWLGKIWLGTLRQGKPLTTEDMLSTFLNRLWDLAIEMLHEDIVLLEVNPFVLDVNGAPMALDGVGVKDLKPKIKPLPKTLHNPAPSVLNPKKMAVIGVSSKANSFGTLILNNLLKSDIGRENLVVIRPNETQFMGVKCLPNVAALHHHPVDALVLCLPAKASVETLIELCESGAGADTVYLVAGGIGDGADKEGLADKLKLILRERRSKGQWTPAVVGPNNLGILLAHKKLTTMFLPEGRMDLKFHESGNIAFISQSGAFFASRFSNEENAAIKYGFCIGNQMDLNATDFLEIASQDEDIDVFAVYIEGFETDGALAFATKARELAARGKHVILYKAGRSESGALAAAGHTGSMAGNYDIQRHLFKEANVIVTETFRDFSNTIKWLSAWPENRIPGKAFVITNAGAEAVSSGDWLGQGKTGNYGIYSPIKDKEREIFSGIITRSGLAGLVSAKNPLDLTPMADEKAYLECIQAAILTEATFIVVGIIPLTERMASFDLDKTRDFAKEIKRISKQAKKPIAMVIDAGDLYNSYRDVLTSAGLPVFRSMEDPLAALKILTE